MFGGVQNFEELGSAQENKAHFEYSNMLDVWKFM